MSVYQGDYARLYDLFYADKPYEEEARFVDALLRKHASGPSRRLLDVACGTGQHSVRLAALGWDVIGVDLSNDMLVRARERLGDLSVQFLEQDMRSLDLSIKDFDAAVCLFDSIGYGISNEAIGATLTGIRNHLRSRGLFLAEFWHAAPMLTDYESIRVRQWETEDGQVLRISRTTLDVPAQVAQVEYEVYELGSDRTFAKGSEVHQNRYFLVQEMRHLLQVAGFEPIDWFAGFDTEGKVNESTWHVVVLARSSD